MFLVVHASPAASDDARATTRPKRIFWFGRTKKSPESAHEWA